MSKTILICDDNGDARELLAMALSARHYAVKVCPDRDNGIVLITHDKEIACVILDYNMPGMSIKDFIQQAVALNPNIAFVLATATHDVKKRAEELGLKHFLEKPFDFEELYTRIEEALAEHR